jgi:hypothetical protein
MSVLLFLLSLSVACCTIPPVVAQTTAPVVIGLPFIANGTDPTKGEQWMGSDQPRHQPEPLYRQ